MEHFNVKSNKGNLIKGPLIFKPKIFFVSSFLKPFITDITIIKMATPSIIPRKEKIDIIFKKPSFFFGLRFLDEINLSTFVNKLLSFKFRFNILYT